MDTYLTRMFGKAVEINLAETMKSVNDKILANHEQLENEHELLRRQYERLRAKMSRVDPIEATYRVVSTTDKSQFSSSTAKGDSVRCADLPRTPSPPPLSWNELMDQVLRHVTETETGRYAEYQQVLNAAKFTKLFTDDNNRNRRDEEFRIKMFELLYNPSITHAKELAITFNNMYANVTKIDRRKRGKSGVGKTKKTALALEFESTTTTMGLTHVSSWFVEMLSVFELAFKQLESATEGIGSGAALLRRDDLPSPRLFDDVFYGECKGKRIHADDENLSSSSQLTKPTETFRTYTFDTNNLLTLFANEMFGYVSFTPEQVDVDRGLMEPTRFADLQLFVDFALLRHSRDEHKEYLEYPSKYIFDLTKRRILVDAMISTSQFLFATKPENCVFRVERDCRVQLCKVIQQPGAECGRQIIEALPIPKAVMGLLRNLQIPNMINYRKRLDRLLPVYTGPANIMQQEVVELRSPLSLLMNFDQTAIDEVQSVFAKMLKKGRGYVSDAQQLSMTSYAEDRMLQSRQHIYFNILTVAAVMVATKPKNVTTHIDANYFIDHCMCGMNDPRYATMPDHKAPIAFNSVFGACPGLLFYVELGAEESIIDVNGIDMKSTSYFRQKTPEEILASCRPSGRHDAARVQQESRRRLNLSATETTMSDEGRFGIPDDNRAIRKDRLLFFELFGAFTDRIPKISEAGLMKKNTTTKSGSVFSNVAKLDPLTGIEGPRVVDKKRDLLPMVVMQHKDIMTVKTSFMNLLMWKVLGDSGSGGDGGRPRRGYSAMSYFKNRAPFTRPLDAQPMVTETFDLDAMYASAATGDRELFAMPITYSHSKVEFIPEEMEARHNSKYRRCNMDTVSTNIGGLQFVRTPANSDIEHRETVLDTDIDVASGSSAAFSTSAVTSVPVSSVYESDTYMPLTL